ncbi:MAG: secondary thiamine-phosphate synthase enzyme YjbQ [Oscillospiraceae bacterium]
MSVREFHLSTPREGMMNITSQVSQAVRESGVTSGLCVVFTPHTTAAITINENADPDVVRDFMLGMDTAFPHNRAFHHAEGNSPAHLKSSSVGCSETIIVENGRLLLGTWQGIWFCEFDGPRNRRFWVKIISDGGAVS